MPFKIFSNHGCTVSKHYPTFDQIQAEHFTDQVWITQVDFEEVSAADIELVKEIQRAIAIQKHKQDLQSCENSAALEGCASR